MADVENALTVFRFGVEIGGKVAEGSFTRVSGISYSNDVVESRTTGVGGQALTIKKQAGPSRWTPIKLTAAVTTDLSFNDWIKETIEGGIDAARTNWSIIAYDQSESEVARWDLENAWVSDVSYTSLKAGTGDIQQEILTIEHEGIMRTA